MDNRQGGTARINTQPCTSAGRDLDGKTYPSPKRSGAGRSARDAGASSVKPPARTGVPIEGRHQENWRKSALVQITVGGDAMKPFRSLLMISDPLVVMTGVPAGAQAPSAKAAAQAVARAWCAGDLPAMYRMWDAHSRRMVSLPQLEAAFTRHPAAPGGRTGAAISVVLGRPAAFVRDHATVETDSYATADCAARFSFQSLCGDRFSVLLPGMVRDAKRERNGINLKTLLVLEKYDPGDRPSLLDTAKGDFKTATSGQGASNDLPPASVAAAVGVRSPFITLYFHRYVLTREGDDWKIANAVTVGAHPGPPSGSSRASRRAPE